MNSFVKWAGGKRQLVSRLKKLIPENYNTYIEPFIGGGALLFELHPPKAIIGDINSNLISVYNEIKENPYEIMELLKRHEEEHKRAEDKTSYYLSVRKNYNNNIMNNVSNTEVCAQFIYLNKACFNGLYRVNKKGQFNVPFGKKDIVNTFSEDNIKEISEYLKNVTIYNQDFEETCSIAKAGDFIFFDSPYDLIKDTSFSAYDKSGFLKEDHIRLAQLYKELDQRGCYCMLTNHNTDLINELYSGFNIKVVSVKRMINSNASNRVGEEIIVTNYDVI